MKKNKIYTYHKYHSFVDENGKKVTTATQQYQCGVYMIINGNSRLQFNITPKKIVTIEKALKANKKIKNLTFGKEIKVTEDEDGFWKEVE